MILQGSLQMEYNDKCYDLIVKTFLMSGIYYFFISDKESDNSLLAGEILELTYTDSYCITDEGEHASNHKIPPDIVSAIKKTLSENKQLWYY